MIDILQVVKVVSYNAVFAVCLLEKALCNCTPPLVCSTLATLILWCVWWGGKWKPQKYERHANEWQANVPWNSAMRIKLREDVGELTEDSLVWSKRCRPSAVFRSLSSFKIISFALSLESDRHCYFLEFAAFTACTEQRLRRLVASADNAPVVSSPSVDPS